MPLNPSIKKYLLPALILLLSIAAVMALISTKPVAKKRPVTELAWNVTAQKAELSSHKPIIRLYGQLISQSAIEISSAVEAQVKKRWVENGEYVTKGQRLITFDSTKYQFIYEQRLAETQEIEFLIKEEVNRNHTDNTLLIKEKALLQIAKNAVKRSQALEKSAMASGSQIDDARKSSLTQQIAIAQRNSTIKNHPIRLAQLKSKLSQTKSRLALAKRDLSKTQIDSPVNGFIHNISVNIAEQVSPGKVIIRLFDNEQKEIRALLPEKYSTILRQALARNETLTGAASTENSQQTILLTRVSGNVESGLAGSYVYFKFLTANNIALFGQTLDISLNLPAIENSIALPHDALYGTNNIFKIVDGHLQRLTVEWLGETAQENQQTLILIRSTKIKANDLLLTSKFANAAHGLSVNVSHAE